VFTRRAALKGVAALAVTRAWPTLGCTNKDSVPPPQDPVFGHGVASGDPLPDAVILWTRVTADTSVDVQWEVSKDATFGRIASSGTSKADASRGWTVKVDVKGLEPGTAYYYRFRALGRSSPIGRTRTAPSDPKQLRFAVVSCASVPHGYFHAYAAIAQRQDLDAVVHLGDYIYEYGEGQYGKVRTSEPTHECQSLADYRQRYAQYRRDPNLQEAHRQHPFICIWDDHEFVDNAYQDGATGDDPVQGPWEEQRKAASQAYSEWIPIRDQSDGRIWRILNYGGLVDLFLLDTRIWGRDIQLPQGDPGITNDRRQILGSDQEKWLTDNLRKSKARWKLIGQQVMMTSTPAWFHEDGWDEYPAARKRFFDVLEKNHIEDVVVLSGDVHSSWASELSRTPEGSPIAVELITPAVSAAPPESRSAADVTKGAPFVKYADLVKRGFILLSVYEERVHAVWYHVEDVEKEDGGRLTLSAGFALKRGDAHLENATTEPDQFESPAPAPT
jgi:alkaline phosphatase D